MGDRVVAGRQYVVIETPTGHSFGPAYRFRQPAVEELEDCRRCHPDRQFHLAVREVLVETTYTEWQPTED